LLLKYRNIKNELTKEIRISKNTYWRKLLSKNFDNPKNKWKVINKILLKKSKKLILPNTATPTKLTNYDLNISKMFNEYYNKLYNDDQNNPDNCDINYIDECLSNILTTNKDKAEMSTINPTTIYEVSKTIKKLKTSHTTNSTGISSFILKRCVNTLAPILTIFINRLFSNGDYPSILKTSYIIPIFKSGDTNDTSNYRPISLASAISKLIDKIYLYRLQYFFTNNNLLYTKQFAYTHSSNTIDAIYEVINPIIQSLNSKLKVIATFIDLKKAFDSVNLILLLYKLKKYGITDAALNFLTNYLTKRKITTRIYNSFSNPINISKGIPQGSALSALLFLIYTNDLGFLTLFSKLVMYADDAALVSSAPNFHLLFEQLQSDLDIINKWMFHNKFSININKTKFMNFYFNKKSSGSIRPSSPTLVLKIHDPNCRSSSNCSCQLLQEVESNTYLGVIIDSRLRWTQQIKRITNKLLPSLILSYKIKNIINSKTAKLIYHALIKPVFCYANIFYGGTFKSHLESLKKLVKRIQANFFVETDEDSLMTFDQLYMYNLSIFTHFRNQPLIQDIKYQLRSKRKIRVTRPNFEVVRHQIDYISQKVYSVLPEAILKIKSSQKCKEELKVYIVKNHVTLSLIDRYKE
jgi:hypothetical protein